MRLKGNSHSINKFNKYLLKSVKIMRNEIEKRLHRVKITLNKNKIVCPRSEHCNKAESGARCDIYFEKCSIYNQSIN